MTPKCGIILWRFSKVQRLSAPPYKIPQPPCPNYHSTASHCSQRHLVLPHTAILLASLQSSKSLAKPVSSSRIQKPLTSRVSSSHAMHSAVPLEACLINWRDVLPLKAMRLHGWGRRLVHLKETTSPHSSICCNNQPPRRNLSPLMPNISLLQLPNPIE